ncbi:MAG: AsnC family transcriptional regulator, partial [Merdibacter sp.]
MAEKQYLLGSDEQQAWMRDYFFAPRGIGFTEPGTVGLDSAEFSAYNVAKSFYQNYPEVFNIAMIQEKTDLAAEEITKRLKRMYDEHLIMFVMNPAVAVYGWGLYYWVVKLKDGTDPKVKQQLSEWFQNKDDICTGYETSGDFDYFNGNHMRVLDNLLYDV